MKVRLWLSEMRRQYQLWLMILPAIAVIFIFNYIPMYGIQLAFRDYDFSKGLTGGEWRGWYYFQQFIESYMFTDLIRNTFMISFTSIVVGFPAPILLALILNQIRVARWKQIMQTTVFMPHFISIIVLVGMLNVLLSPETGIVGYLLRSMGIEGVNLLGSTKWFIPVYVLSDIWQHVGWNSIIYLAALSSVDPQLYDAARIDGASRWQTIRHIDLPALVPTIIILFILSMGGILATGFEKIFLMQNSLNLPVSEVIATYVYKIGIISNQFSYASAIGLFNTVINFFFLFVVNLIARRTSNMSLF
jgi:putative aldouronate transport system permease protein